jgi:hypothetical protein
MIRENLRVAQSMYKSYVDHRRRELSFEVEDFVYLKLSPMRGLRRFKVRGKLAPRFIGPFKILEKRCKVASPMRGLRHFKVRGKLAPRFIGPFKILEKRCEVAYQLELPP